MAKVTYSVAIHLKIIHPLVDYFRILTGFAGGAFVSAAPAYTAETAEQR